VSCVVQNPHIKLARLEVLRGDSGIWMGLPERCEIVRVEFVVKKLMNSKLITRMRGGFHVKWNDEMRVCKFDEVSDEGDHLIFYGRLF